MIKMQDKINLAIRNIRKAISDYGLHTSKKTVIEDISEDFVSRLARDNYWRKFELRALFRRSPHWNEDLDCLILEGVRECEPDYHRIEYLLDQLFVEQLDHVRYTKRYKLLTSALCWFTLNGSESEFIKEERLNALKAIAPKAWAPNKRITRVLYSLCVALGVNTSSSEFKRIFPMNLDVTKRRLLSCLSR